MILMRKEADERFVAYVPIMRAAQECVRKILFQEKPGGKAGNKKARQAGLFLAYSGRTGTDLVPRRGKGPFG